MCTSGCQMEGGCYLPAFPLKSDLSFHSTSPVNEVIKTLHSQANAPQQNCFEFSFYSVALILFTFSWCFISVLSACRDFEKIDTFHLDLYLFPLFLAHHWLKHMLIIFLTHDILRSFLWFVSTVTSLCWEVWSENKYDQVHLQVFWFWRSVVKTGHV